MKIILAVDLYDNNPQDPLIYDELKRWCEDIKVDVKPVFIHASSIETQMIQDQLSSAEANAPEFFKNFSELKIIHLPDVGRKKEIEALLAYAKEEKAELIALVSQGKAKLEKKLLGSFAESLLLKSDLPLLFLDEEASTRVNKTNKILFATDFSEASKEGFIFFLNQIKYQNPEIILFNAIPLPQLAVTGVVYAQALSLLPQQYWDEQQKWAERKSHEFLEEAYKLGLKAKAEIANQVYSVESAIHETVKREKVRLVAMISVSQPLQRLMLGSVSISILRTRVKPIWICGPQCLGNKLSQ